ALHLKSTGVIRACAASANNSRGQPFMSTSDRAYSEKRDFIRMRLEAPVTLVHDGQQIPALCLDLSSNGMQVEAATRLAIGDRIGVHIPSEHDQLADLNVEAEVVRALDLEDGRQSLGLSVLSMLDRKSVV